MNIFSKAAVLAAVIISFCACTASAAPGDRDSAFGTAGVVETQVMGFNGEAHAIAHDSAGRLVVAGYSYNEDLDTSVIVVARFNSDGSLDTSFGDLGTGFVTTTPPAGVTFGTNSFAIAMDSKDRIVVGGDVGVYDPSGNLVEMFCVARYLPSGLLDASFGGSGLVQTLISPGTIVNVATSVAVDAEDRVVAGGYMLDGIASASAIVRYREDGTQDHSFGGTGVVTLSPYGAFKASSVRIDSAGRVVVLGSDFDISSFASVSVVARYLDDGTPDSSFGNAMPGVSAVSDIGANALLIDGSNNLLIAGEVLGDSTFGVERLDSSGTPDASFGTDGMARTWVGLVTLPATDLNWDSHGDIVAATTSEANFVALRITPDGMLDTKIGRASCRERV